MPEYSVTLARRYDGLFIATLPDLPEVVAFGRDEEEALEEAAKCLDHALRRRSGRGEAVPPARTTGALRISAGQVSAPTMA